MWLIERPELLMQVIRTIFAFSDAQKISLLFTLLICYFFHNEKFEKCHKSLFQGPYVWDKVQYTIINSVMLFLDAEMPQFLPYYMYIEEVHK